MFNKWSLTPVKGCRFIDTVPICEQIYTQIFFAEFQTFDHLQSLEQGTYGLKVKLQIMSGKDWAYDKCEGTEGKILELTTKSIATTRSSNGILHPHEDQTLDTEH